MKYTSTHTHSEGYATGCPVEDLVKQAKALGRTHIAFTDHGHLMSIMKGYKLAKKYDIKFIPGIELYFRDDLYSPGTLTSKCRYYHLTLHCFTQEAYQSLCSVISYPNLPMIKVADEEHPIFGWGELEKLIKPGFTVSSSGPNCLMFKPTLVGAPEVTTQIINKLIDLFGKENIYFPIMVYNMDRYWDSEKVIVTLSNGKKISLSGNSRIDTDKISKIKAKELAGSQRHKYIANLYHNHIKYEINQDIIEATTISKYENIGKDVIEQYNKWVVQTCANLHIKQQITVSDYAYFSEPSMKMVQDMKLGDSFRYNDSMHMKDATDLLDIPGSSESTSVGANDFIDKICENSANWASRFNHFKFDYPYRLVEFNGDPLKKVLELIKKNGRYDHTDPIQVARLKREIDVIHRNGTIGLLPYFFPVADIYDAYKEAGLLTGPGRGSLGSSFMAYCIGITQVNPLVYDLPFERFLSIDRIKAGDYPDADVDLPNRDLLIGYDGKEGLLTKLYGDRWAQISTRINMRLKSSIKDVNRFINGGTVEPDVEEFATTLDAPPQGISDKDYVFGFENDGAHVPGLLEKSEELQKFAVERKEEWKIVEKCLGISRQVSRHASAWVISDTAISNIVPVMKVNGTTNITQYEAKDCEAAGLIKYDFLCINVLNYIQKCLELIKKKHNSPKMDPHLFEHNSQIINVWDLPVDHEANARMHRGEIASTWQTNTQSMLPFVKAIKPGLNAKSNIDIIMDYANILALVRPGPLDFKDTNTGRNMAEEYVERRFGRSTSDIPEMMELLPESYGIIIYQENLSKIAVKLAGMDIIDAENLRRHMCKKKMKQMLEMKPKFIEGAVKKISKEVAENIWNQMVTFGQYGFSIIHSVEYAMTTYATVWLKHNYPLEWWTAVMSHESEDKIISKMWDNVKDYLAPPNVNVSTDQMEIDYESNKIRSRLSVIAGIGPKLEQSIICNKPYLDLKDFVTRSGCGEPMAAKLTLVGALDSLMTKTNLEDKLSELSVAFKIKKIEIDRQKGKNSFDNAKEKLYDKTNLIKIMKDSLHALEGNKKIKAEGLIIKHTESVSKIKSQLKKMVEPDIDSTYIGLTEKQQFMMKKSIMPTFRQDVLPLVLKKNKVGISNFGKAMIHSNNKMYPVLKGDNVVKFMSMKVESENRVTVGAVGLVMESKEFTYKDGERKALKMTVDFDGNIMELVKWPDYDSGELVYPVELKNPCIVAFVLSRKQGSDYTNIFDLLIDETSK